MTHPSTSQKTQNQLTDFNSLPKWMVNNLKEKKILKPTDVQAATIPALTANKDLLITAATGSGKTIAYLAPIISALSITKKASLVIVPTRELAKQIEHEAKWLAGKQSPLNIVALIGGAPFHMQKRLLKQKPNVIIGTPGRIIDHLEKRNLSLDHLTHLVLDETDRLLDQGFMPQVHDIRSYIEHKPQTILLSATLPKQQRSGMTSLLTDPTQIQIGEINQPKTNIKVNNRSIKKHDKLNTLKSILDEPNKTHLVFINTKRHVEQVSQQLKENDIHNDILHGDIPHRKRQRIIKQFREGTIRTLIATDVAARGIDITHIDCVINYDLPIAPEDYIHRIGRSARGNNRKGQAINFLTNEDKPKWDNIENFITGKPTKKISPHTKKRGHSSKNSFKKYGDNSKPFRKNKSSEEKKHFSKRNKNSNSNTKKSFKAQPKKRQKSYA